MSYPPDPNDSVPPTGPDAGGAYQPYPPAPPGGSWGGPVAEPPGGLPSPPAGTSWSGPPPVMPPAPWAASQSPKRTQILIVTILGQFCCGLLWIWSFLDARKEKELYPQDTMVVVCYWVSLIALCLMGAGIVGAVLLVGLNLAAFGVGS